jgi:hypothetical protein
MNSKLLRNTSSMLLIFIIVYTSFLIAKIGEAVYNKSRWIEISEQTTLKSSDRSNLQQIDQIRYRSYTDNQLFLELQADSIALRHPRLANILYKDFYELVISGVRVYVPKSEVIEILDWAKSSTLTNLIAPFMNPDLVKQGFSTKALKIRFEDIEVYQGEEDQNSTELIVSAESMVKEPFSEELTFEGNFRFTANAADTFYCDAVAKWMLPQGRIFFPLGYKQNRAVMEPGTLVLSRLESDPEGLDELSSDGVASESYADGLTGGNPSILASPGSPPIQDFNAFLERVKAKNPHEVRGLMWEMLALNPGILRQAGISPALLLFGGEAKLGEFEVNPGGIMNLREQFHPSSPK